MPLFYDRTLDLNDPAVDTTLQICGNSLFLDRARADYGAAFARAAEYVSGEKMQGDVMEFGTYSGFTARILAEAMRDYEVGGALHLFDTFTGFPDSSFDEDRKCLRLGRLNWWREGELSAPPGIALHIAERLAPILGPERLQLYPGTFQTCLPAMAAGRKATIVHLDCDLYASAKYVLDTLYIHDCLQGGTVLLCDDYYCNRASPNFGEQAALRDFQTGQPRFEIMPWFSYSWGAHAFFIHDKLETDQRTALIT